MLREWFTPEDGWKPVSRAALAGWGIFYLLFLWHAAADEDGFLLLDHANLIIHEAGHFFFSWFGFYTGILGGTLGELIVPLLCGWYFLRKGETTAVAFCAFWCCENFLYIGTYMADARTMALPLVGSGDHDWELLFTHWGLLVHDRTIGGWTRTLGWLGMTAAVGWLAWMHLRTREET